MAISKILIIEKPGGCSQQLSRLLAKEDIEVLSTSKTDVARKILADHRPELIMVDCDLCPDPLFWLKEADCFGLDSQVVAISGEPNFD